MITPDKKDYIKKENSENEIDLSRLFNSILKGIGNFFKGIFRLFFLFIDIIVANTKLILSTIIIGGLLGLGYFFLTKPYYESSMTLGSVYYRGQLINNSIENLNLLCKEGNYKSLSKILKIPIAKANDLRSIQIEPVISPNMKMLIDLYKDTEGNKRRLDSIILKTEDTTFQIKAQVFDTTALKGLDTSLVNYILTNKYVKKRIEIERFNLKNRKAKLIRESTNLDTLKRNIALSYRTQAGGRTGTNNVIMDDKGTNPIEVYREDMRLYEQQLKIDRLLYLNSEIEIIDSFIAYGDPKSGTLFKNVVKGLLIGLILALLVVIYKMVIIAIKKMRLILKQEDSLQSTIYG